MKTVRKFFDFNDKKTFMVNHPGYGKKMPVKFRSPAGPGNFRVFFTPIFPGLTGYDPCASSAKKV